jgi:hypothetical protein
MVPETPSELFQLNTVGLAPEGVEPDPVPMVVQPHAMTASIGSIVRKIDRRIVMTLLPMRLVEQ